MGVDLACTLHVKPLNLSLLICKMGKLWCLLHRIDMRAGGVWGGGLMHTTCLDQG